MMSETQLFGHRAFVRNTWILRAAVRSLQNNKNHTRWQSQCCYIIIQTFISYRCCDSYHFCRCRSMSRPAFSYMHFAQKLKDRSSKKKISLFRTMDGGHFFNFVLLSSLLGCMEAPTHRYYNNNRRNFFSSHHIHETTFSFRLIVVLFVSAWN